MVLIRANKILFIFSILSIQPSLNTEKTKSMNNLFVHISPDQFIQSLTGEWFGPTRLQEGGQILINIIIIIKVAITKQNTAPAKISLSCAT